ncbi:MAG: DsbA family protein [Nannocystales bacterium]
MNASRRFLLLGLLGLASACQAAVDAGEAATSGDVEASSSSGSLSSDSGSGDPSTTSTTSTPSEDVSAGSSVSSGVDDSGSSSSTGAANTCGSPPVDPHDLLQITDAPMRGNPDGLVTLVLWTSYRCSYCREFEATLDMLLDGPVGDEVRIVVKPIPFSEENDPDGRLARAGYAAHQLGDYWAFHAAMLAAEGDLLDEVFLDTVIADVGFDVEAFREAMGSDAAYERVATDVALISDIALGVPTSVINGWWVLGAIGPIELQLGVEPQLEAMQALIDTGMTPCAALGQRIDEQFPPR